MKLEQLYPNFAELSERDQLAFVRNYRNKRFMELQTYTPTTEARPKKKRKSTKKKALPPVDSKDMELLKKLGISAKDVSKMRK